MPDLLGQISEILLNGPLVLRFAVLAGFVLIVIAVVPSLSIPLLKGKELTLTRNQSIILGAIGCVSLVGGLAGIYLSEMTDVSPIIQEWNITPDDNRTFGVGSTLSVNIMVKEPDLNFFQKIRKPTLLFNLKLLDPANRSIRYDSGPMPKCCFRVQVSHDIAGRNLVRINVTDRPPYEKDAKFLSMEKNYTIEIANNPPQIEDVSPSNGSSKPIDRRLVITAKVTDQNNDMLYYNFYRMPPTLDKWFEIPPQDVKVEQDKRYWTPNESDIGENLIRVIVRDGDDNGPWEEKSFAIKDWTINIIGTKT
jgi:hypothetical protein